jgi:hypothetical protein
MPKTRINCPNCRQPVMADIEQLFDQNVDPGAKQRLLSGAANVIQCPSCGFEGAVATPIIYHDPEKELLLTFFPPDVSMSRDEQERLIGPLVNQVMNRLPQEKRKAYLLRPQAVLTMQGLVERILEADGITRDMIQAQQDRLKLLQRMMSASDDVLEEIARQEDIMIDEDFFNILTRIVESAIMQGDRESAQRLSDLQKKLIPLTTFGQKLEAQSREAEAAIRTLQDLGRELTREKLLDLVLAADNDTRLSVYASFARPALDYTFFEMLSERINQSTGEERQRLEGLREKLLEMTRELDRQMELRLSQTKELLNALIEEEDIDSVIQQSLPMVDEFFIQVLNGELAAARQAGDLKRLEKLQKVVNVIQQASAPPPEVQLIEEILDLDNEQERRTWLESHRQEITPQFLETLTALLSQSQGGGDQELQQRLKAVYRSALRFSMESNLNK